jgi:AraC family transcriptional regulator
MITATHLKPSKIPVSLLVPNGDFYHVTEHLTEAERNGFKRVGSFMETKVAPVITDFWARDCAAALLETARHELDSDHEAADVLPADLPLGYLASSLALLLEVVRHELDHDREAAKASLATASTILQYEIERRSGAKRSKTGGLTGWQIARVRAFIDKNLHRTIHTQDLSAVARRSPAHFSRLFKLTFGEPPHAYVVKRRLEKACHLMVTGSASLSVIALSAGFSDQAHLCKLFRQVFGQSPASWRREREIQ